MMKRARSWSSGSRARDVTVLIRGESGTGKELVARALVARPRGARRRPFVRFNCAAHRRGARRSRAVRPRARAPSPAPTAARAGLFRQADGGTLFLDEIGELDLGSAGQAAARAAGGRGAAGRRGPRAQGRRARRRRDAPRPRAPRCETARSARTSTTGSTWCASSCRRCASAPKTSRCSSSTSCELRRALRHREPALTASARAAPGRHGWPGNVRELENAVERLVALASGSNIDDVEGEQVGVTEPLGLKERVDAYERGLILAELKRAGWNRSEAARRLKIGTGHPSGQAQEAQRLRRGVSSVHIPSGSATSLAFSTSMKRCLALSLVSLHVPRPSPTSERSPVDEHAVATLEAPWSEVFTSGDPSSTRA